MSFCSCKPDYPPVDSPQSPALSIFSQWVPTVFKRKSMSPEHGLHHSPQVQANLFRVRVLQHDFFTPDLPGRFSAGEIRFHTL